MYKIKQSVNFSFNLLVSFALSGVFQLSALSQAQALPPVDCAEGFVGVPGNDFYDTKDFCVMKYEAKEKVVANGANEALSKPEETPWVNINRAEALQACENSNLKLMTNNHWQTIAHNIELVPKNWANNEIGNVNGLNQGHSDNAPSKALDAGDGSDPCVNTGNDCTSGWTDQKRTHTLSNRGKEEVIWDIAGNVWEWVSDHNLIDYGSGFLYISMLEDIDLAKKPFGASGDYSTTLGDSSSYGNLGMLITGTGGGVVRGGNWKSYAEAAGLFAAYLDLEPSFRHKGLGFRCFYYPE